MTQSSYNSDDESNLRIQSTLSATSTYSSDQKYPLATMKHSSPKDIDAHKLKL